MSGLRERLANAIAAFIDDESAAEKLALLERSILSCEKEFDELLRKQAALHDSLARVTKERDQLKLAVDAANKRVDAAVSTAEGNFVGEIARLVGEIARLNEVISKLQSVNDSHANVLYVQQQGLQQIVDECRLLLPSPNEISPDTTAPQAPFRLIMNTALRAIRGDATLTGKSIKRG